MEQVPFQNYNFKYNETHINCRIDMQGMIPRGLLKCILKASKTEHILKEFKLMITVCVFFFLSNLSNVTLYSFFSDFSSNGLPPVKLQKGPTSTSKSVFICLPQDYLCHVEQDK